MISFFDKTSSFSLGVQKTSAAFKQYPSSTTQSDAILDKTSFVPERLNPAPSNLFSDLLRKRFIECKMKGS